MKLPSKLLSIIRGYKITKHPYNETRATIYYLSKLNEQGLFLKILMSNTSHLIYEYEILRWINERIKTPKPVFYQRKDNTEYLLTTEIKGTPTYQVEPSEREKTVKILAKTLRKIHNLDVEECPFNRTLSNKIVLIENKQLNTGQKYKLDFIKNNKLDETPVFTHGDYCLPNIIINGNRLSGVIDWDYAGLADPYVDFVLVTWSLKYNYGEIESKKKWIPLFFKEYEIHVNQEKMKYYQILNELFS